MNSSSQSEIKDILGALRVHAQGLERPEAQKHQLDLLDVLEGHIKILWNVGGAALRKSPLTDAEIAEQNAKVNFDVLYKLEK
jgi:hypothetical protein